MSQGGTGPVGGWWRRALGGLRDRARRLVTPGPCREPAHACAVDYVGRAEAWLLKELTAEPSALRPDAPPARNLSKTFEVSDFAIPKVREYARSIIDFLGAIDYGKLPYATALGPIMNGHAYVKVWEVAYVAAACELGPGRRVLIAGSGPSYWIPVWHKEVLGCDATCFDKHAEYGAFKVEESAYRRHGIPFSYQDAGEFHYEERFDAIVSHCAVEHFFGGAARRFVMRADRYLAEGGVFGCATQIWDPACPLLGREVPQRGYIFFSEGDINRLMAANPALESLDYGALAHRSRPFACCQDWARPNFLEVDPGRYVFEGVECRTVCAAFFLKKAGKDRKNGT